ncbi:MAG: hypothetical protein Q7S03_02405 [bacterium]|nr:hypothetical protein [bacterium]
MTDTDETKVVEETTPTVEPETEEAPVVSEEPKVEEPAASPAVSTGGATQVGTDQQGRQLYEVKCSDCGKATQVPFNPTGDRPVYCRDCYMKHKNG